jgi:hypothetical protein
MMQAIDAHLPGIFENGAGLYYAHPYSFLPHPALAGSDQIPQVREALDRELIQTGRAFIQPGKLHTLTLFAEDPAETRLLAEWAEAALGPLATQVDLVYFDLPPERPAAWDRQGAGGGLARRTDRYPA